MLEIVNQLSACLYVAAKLTIADLVAHKRCSTEDLSARTGTNADALSAFCDRSSVSASLPSPSRALSPYHLALSRCAATYRAACTVWRFGQPIHS